VHKIAVPAVEQAGQLLQLLGAGSLGQEGDDVFHAALVHAEDLQRVADEVELAFSHPVGVEDVGLGPESIGEHQCRRLLAYGAADEAGDFPSRSWTHSARRGVAALEGLEGLGGEVQRGAPGRAAGNRPRGRRRGRWLAPSRGLRWEAAWPYRGCAKFTTQRVDRGVAGHRLNPHVTDFE
jgi:hypothetical protein